MNFLLKLILKVIIVRFAIADPLVIVKKLRIFKIKKILYLYNIVYL